MPSRNFNTFEMKIAFANFDEEDRTLRPMTPASFTKLKHAVTYAIERSKNRSSAVRVVIVLDPDTEFTAEHSYNLMSHVASEGVRVLSTCNDMILLKVPTQEGAPASSFNVVVIKFIGGTKFVAVLGTDDANSSDEAGSCAMDDNGESRFTTVANDLALECDLNY